MAIQAFVWGISPCYGPPDTSEYGFFANYGVLDDQGVARPGPDGIFVDVIVPMLYGDSATSIHDRITARIQTIYGDPSMLVTFCAV